MATGRLRFLLMACALAVLPARAGDTIPLWFRADITIATDGRVAAFEWRNFTEMPPAVLDGLEGIVPNWRFQPARRDGVAMETETTLFVRMQATELPDGAFGLSIVEAFVGPSLAGGPEPEGEAVPVIVMGPLRSAELVFDATFPAGGDPTLEILDYQASTHSDRYRKETEAMAEDVLAGWKVRHERVAGEPVAARLRYVLGRCMDSNWCARNRPESVTSVPAMPPGQPVPLDSVARLLSEVNPGSP